MTVRTDNNEWLDVECAMVDVFFDYAEGRLPCTRVLMITTIESTVQVPV
jgi:hypothetical protein